MSVAAVEVKNILRLRKRCAAVMVLLPRLDDVAFPGGCEDMAEAELGADPARQPLEGMMGPTPEPRI